MRTDVCVVGGGIAGLAAAARLVAAGLAVTVLEGTDDPGGRARDTRVGGFVLGDGAHLLHTTWPTLRQTISPAELQLGGFAAGVRICSGGGGLSGAAEDAGGLSSEERTGALENSLQVHDVVNLKAVLQRSGPLLAAEAACILRGSGQTAPARADPYACRETAQLKLGRRNRLTQGRPGRVQQVRTVAEHESADPGVPGAAPGIISTFQNGHGQTCGDQSCGRGQPGDSPADDAYVRAHTNPPARSDRHPGLPTRWGIVRIRIRARPGRKARADAVRPAYSPEAKVYGWKATSWPTSSWMTSCGVSLMSAGFPVYFCPFTYVVTVPEAGPTWLLDSGWFHSAKTWPSVYSLVVGDSTCSTPELSCVCR